MMLSARDTPAPPFHIKEIAMPEGVSATGSLRAQRVRLAEMTPLIITAAITGDHHLRDNPNLPQTAEEQAQAAADIVAAGASILHIHGRSKEDPAKGTNQPDRYREINAAMRAKAPEVIIDNTQTVAALTDTGDLTGKLNYYKSAPMYANPELMSLNPGPMTFRGGPNGPSSAYVTTFDDTARTAAELRERNIKPQVFLYHPGHLDLLDYLIEHDVLTPPYFVQLVFGQQSGIPCTPDSVLYMVRNLPPNTIFQTCALGLDAIEVNLLSILLGGHVRTGMEDALQYRQGELTTGNKQLVERIVTIATEVGRPIATPAQTRALLGLSAPSTY
jgi:3-keto-5-aminohexanoate cleavage enzyme